MQGSLSFPQIGYAHALTSTDALLLCSLRQWSEYRDVAEHEACARLLLGIQDSGVDADDVTTAPAFKSKPPYGMSDGKRRESNAYR